MRLSSFVFRRVAAALLFGAAGLGATSWIACIGPGPEPLEPEVDAQPAVDAGPTIDAQADTGSIDLCPSYCDAVSANCTGANLQYSTKPECLAVCALLQDGGESVSCRREAALTTPPTKEKCSAAGLLGGGTCGSRCSAFCTVVAASCLGLDAGVRPYTTKSNCTEACTSQLFPDPSGIEGYSSQGNTVNCRGYHAILSLPSTADREMHCPHTAVISDTCNDAGLDGGGP